MEKGLGGSDETNTNEVDSRGLTSEDRVCLVGGLNVASAIISQHVGQSVFLTVPALRVGATDNSPALVERNDRLAKEWQERWVAEKEKINRNAGGMDGACLFLAMLEKK